MRATLAVIVDWSIYNVYNGILAFISTTTTKKEVLVIFTGSLQGERKRKKKEKKGKKNISIQKRHRT